MTAPVFTVRAARADDLPAILEISNWAALNTAANFAVESETLDAWEREWHETHEIYPWLVADDGTGAVAGFAKASPWKGRCAYAWSAEVLGGANGVGCAHYSGLWEACRALT